MRKYRFGELPDILIKPRDVIDPLVVLAFKDHHFAGEVFSSLLVLMARTEPQPRLARLRELIAALLERTSDFNVTSVLLKSLYEMEKVDG